MKKTITILFIFLIIVFTPHKTGDMELAFQKADTGQKKNKSTPVAGIYKYKLPGADTSNNTNRLESSKIPAEDSFKTVSKKAGHELQARYGSDVKHSRVLNKVKQEYGARQVVIVAAPDDSSFKSRLYAYESRKNGWSRVMTSVDVVTGKRGMGKLKEGDKKTPVGIFTMGPVFGTVPKPQGVKMPYRRTTSNDYWVDDSDSADYNKWVTFEGDPYTRWKSFEKLFIKPYKYAVVVNYNPDCIPGKGSAIFIHIWLGPEIGTSGCTAMSEKNIIKLIQWLDPDKKPVLIQGTDLDISRML